MGSLEFSVELVGDVSASVEDSTIGVVRALSEFSVAPQHAATANTPTDAQAAPFHVRIRIRSP
jgi:hypothetical protein